jgi:phosphoribosylaminoimidazole-succinocarboxamide synthase
MAKRYGIAEGTKLPEPIFEFFYKSDALHDPLCNDDHVRILGWATGDDVAQMRSLTHQVNAVLKPMFAKGGMDLVDYKLEFGHPIDDPKGKLMLGDEFTPDGCRLWDAKTGEKLDKDRFRRDLGGVIEHYREVASASARRCSVVCTRRRRRRRRHAAGAHAAPLTASSARSAHVSGT